MEKNNKNTQEELKINIPITPDDKTMFFTLYPEHLPALENISLRRALAFIAKENQALKGKEKE
jgi:hypothetical protein